MQRAGEGQEVCLSKMPSLDADWTEVKSREAVLCGDGGKTRQRRCDWSKLMRDGPITAARRLVRWKAGHLDNGRHVLWD